jgi:hypothetical protein
MRGALVCFYKKTGVMLRRNTKTVDVTATLFDPIWSFPLLSASFRFFPLLSASFRFFPLLSASFRSFSLLFAQLSQVSYCMSQMVPSVAV